MSKLPREITGYAEQMFRSAVRQGFQVNPEMMMDMHMGDLYQIGSVDSQAFVSSSFEVYGYGGFGSDCRINLRDGVPMNGRIEIYRSSDSESRKFYSCTQSEHGMECRRETVRFSYIQIRKPDGLWTSGQTPDNLALALKEVSFPLSEISLVFEDSGCNTRGGTLAYNRETDTWQFTFFQPWSFYLPDFAQAVTRVLYEIGRMSVRDGNFRIVTEENFRHRIVPS